MQTDLKYIEVSKEVFECDQWQITYIGYDTKKRQNCFVTFPQRETSWIYSLSY